MSQIRPYRGIEAGQRIAERRRRLLEAGLDLLGGEPTPRDLTVRAICAQSGLAARYFYENFTDKDAFVSAVFDWVVADIAATTQAAVAAAPAREQSRAGMTNVVRTISEDLRVGRLLFSDRLANPVVVRKRAESGALFALRAVFPPDSLAIAPILVLASWIVAEIVTRQKRMRLSSTLLALAFSAAILSLLVERGGCPMNVVADHAMLLAPKLIGIVALPLTGASCMAVAAKLPRSAMVTKTRN